LRIFAIFVATFFVLFATHLFAAEVTYEQVAPVLRKYCAGCHNDDDKEGDFSLETFGALQEGIPDGPALLAGNPKGSLIVRLMTGKGKPVMPPEDEPQPSASDVELIQAWIASGAKGPDGKEPDRLALKTPKIEGESKVQPVTAIATHGSMVAVGRYGRVAVYPLGQQLADTALPDLTIDFETQKPILEITELPGKVTAVHFTSDGKRLMIASGVTGLGGVATLWDISGDKPVSTFEGHRDLIYDAEPSPDDRILATCGYDRVIKIWDVASGKLLRELTGHNGAIYDVAFSPDGQFLVSASADDTCKVWRVSDGERLDTLAQPLKEAYCCEFSPDGKFIVAGGADNNLRVWKFVSREKPRINPMVFARYAHEGPIVGLTFAREGKQLVSIAEDRTMKVWETTRYTEQQLWKDQPDISFTLAMMGDQCLVGRSDGKIASVSLPQPKTVGEEKMVAPAVVATMPTAELKTVTELEPHDSSNNHPKQAQVVSVPVTVTGVIHSQNTNTEPDVDLYKFAAKAGQVWVIEVKAARTKSPLDSHIEVLTAAGERIQRVKLQATRESYFTFRGKDDKTISDFRIFAWEEMSLNEYLYANGEVVKLWMYPRGPDSGFNVYPARGARWGFFDTTPLAHALGEPCYIVQPHSPDAELIPNGLPVFPVYYENDDESRRKLGKDSQLTFTAPTDGEYIVRIRDVRGYQGEKFKYSLTIRPRRPDFKVSVSGGSPTVSPGSGKEFTVTAERLDRFEGPIHIDLSGLPPGFTGTTPLIIEAGKQQAFGVIRAAADAEKPTPENSKLGKMIATAKIDGKEVTRTVSGWGEVKLGAKPKLTVKIEPAKTGAQPVSNNNGLLEFAARPGETIMLKLILNRTGENGVISFGKEDSGRNLPFGAYVDNIGLNGLLLLGNQSERNFFITVDPVTKPQTRLFHLNTGSAGGVASQPVLLRVEE